MNPIPAFSIDQALSNWRKTLSKSAVFTHDNLDELESHLRDGFEVNRSGNSDQEAFEIAMEGLGEPEELIELYHENNKKLIWRNYFWIIAISVCIWRLVFYFFNWLMVQIPLTISYTHPQYWNQKLDVYVGCSLCIVFLFLLYKLLNVSHRWYTRVLHILLHNPLYSLLGLFAFLLVYLLEYISGFLLSLHPEPELPGKYSFIIYLGFIYLCIPAIFLVKLYLYSRKRYFSHIQEKLMHRFKLCALSGAPIFILSKILKSISAYFGMFFLQQFSSTSPLESLVHLPLITTASLAVALILYTYMYPEKAINGIKNIINRSYESRLTSTLLFFFILLPLWLVSMGILDSDLNNLQEKLFHEKFSHYLQLGWNIGLILIVTFWSFRRIRNRKVIAWT